MPVKTDSNLTGLRITEETSLGVLGGSEVWTAYEPNSYGDFGAEISTVSRSPINAGRQKLKGVVTDLDASGGFQTDLTHGNLRDIMQGFFFADWEYPADEVVTAVDEVTDDYDVASTTGFQVGNLIWAEGFPVAGNNGLKTVSGIVVDTSVEINEVLAADTPTAASKIYTVGFEGAAGDIDVDTAGGAQDYTSTVADFTTWGLEVGDWIYVGGDGAGESFTTAGNNGFKRISAITANTLSVDKSEGTMATEASTTETVRFFWGWRLHNQDDPANIVRRSYSLERDLEAAGYEYLDGAVPNEMTINVASADKITVDLSFVGTNTSAVVNGSRRSGTFPALDSGGDAFNTSSDFSRISIRDEDADVLVATYVTELSITINNNVVPNKAVSVLGAFDLTAGDFEVTGSLDAYFGDIAAIDAVKNNADTTIDFAIAKANEGMIFDIPLIAMSDGRLNIEKDEPIKIPLEAGGARHPTLLYTMKLNHFPYLPTAAE